MADHLIHDGFTTDNSAKRGRPSLYSPELVATLCASIRQHGWSDHRAALLSGINPKNIWRWKQEHEEFALALESARAEFLADQLSAIASAETKDGQLNWRARAWLLERTFPEEYGRRPLARIEIEVEDDPFASDNAQDDDGPRALTPQYLAELQRRRVRYLEGLAAKRKAVEEAQPHGPDESPFSRDNNL